MGIRLRGNTFFRKFLGKSFLSRDYMDAAVWMQTGDIMPQQNCFTLMCCDDYCIHISFLVIFLGILGIFTKLFFHFGGYTKLIN